MLSRAPLSGVTDSDRTLQEDADAFVNLTLQSLPATEHRLEDIRQQQQQDDVCCLLIRYCQLGWPNKKLPDIVKPYSSVAAELSVQNGLLLRGCRIVVPTAMKQEKLHTGQLGIVKCREIARQSVWWPGLSTQLVQMIKNCGQCCKERCQPAEPLITSEFPKDWNQSCQNYLSKRLEQICLSGRSKHTFLWLISIFNTLKLYC